MPFDKDKIRNARRHLRKSDAVMRAMIEEVGPFTLRVQTNRFAMLIRSIIAQQISVGAARSIQKRLEDLVAPEFVTAESLLRFDHDQLRSVGLSAQKVGYLIDLARQAADGELQLRTIGRHSDDGVIQQLTQVKGIGRWTAQMFLIFALGRLDVFPHDDLGVRITIRDRYELDELPNKQTSTQIAEPWRPYATVASWYCWRSLERARKAKEQTARGRD